jgi:iron complex outermembrane receptor protein
MDWKKNDRDTFTVQGDLYNVVAGQSVQGTSYTPPFSRIVDANAELSGGNIMGRWERVVSDGNDIQVQLYYDRTNRHEANFGENRDTFDVDFLQHIRLPARQTVSWGLGARAGPVNDIEVVSGLTLFPAGERTIC